VKAVRKYCVLITREKWRTQSTPKTSVGVLWGSITRYTRIGRKSVEFVFYLGENPNGVIDSAVHKLLLIQQQITVKHSMKRRSDDSKKSRAVWTAEEDEALLKAVSEDKEDREAEGDVEDEEDWDEIAKFIPGKSPVHCLKRYMALSSKGKANQPKTGQDVQSDNEEDTKPPAKKATESSTFKSDSEGHKQHDEDDAGEEKFGENPSKRARSEVEDAGPTWPEEETDLLKKLVEQYEESEYPQDGAEFVQQFNVGF
jgi:hypothetical protein